jgi:aspartate-semialdehyde dehydrogenase
LDLVLMSAGSAVSREFGRPAAAEGAIVIDNSSAFRMDLDVPLVIPEINGHLLSGDARLIANPNCTTIVVLMALLPVTQAFGLTSLTVASYQAASGAGAEGLSELLAGTREALDGGVPSHRVFSAPLPFNCIPAIGAMLPDGATEEEAKLGHESRKILGLPDLDVAATCVRVPVERAHGAAVFAQFNRVLPREDLLALWSNTPGVRVADLPTPKEASYRDDVLVGRIRLTDPAGRRLSLFACGDQIRKGAALNAVQIAEAVLQRFSG